MIPIPPRPKKQFFIMPNQWTDITHDITSLAELKVIEYVLRHTWGWVDMDDTTPRKISLDEFRNGRRRKNGGRMDRGTGLSRQSIIDGVKLAVEHGYLEAIKFDENGSVKNSQYRLITAEEVVVNNPDYYEDNNAKTVYKIQTTTTPSTVLERSPSSYLQTSSRSSDNQKDSHFSQNGKRTRIPGFLSDEWDSKAAAQLRSILIENDSDLVSPLPPRRGVQLKTLAKSISSLRLNRNVSKDRIKRVLDWLKNHYGDTYTPKMRKAEDFAVHFKRYEEAVQRYDEDDDNTDGTDKLSLIRKAHIWLGRHRGWDPMDSVACEVSESALEDVIEALGLRSGSLTLKDFG